MKVLRYIFNVVLWTLLGLYLLFILTFKIPAVQEYFGERLAELLGERLGTNVSIGSMDINIPHTIRLYDVTVRDQMGHDMLLAKRISARLDLMEIIQGKISIASAQLLSTHALLYQRDSLSKPNYQFVIDSLASKDTTNTAPLDLRINSLIIRNGSVTYNRYDLPETPGVMNPQHLAVSDINAHIILKAMTDDSVNVNVKRLAFREQSGFQLDRLSFKFTGSPRHSLLQDFTLSLPHTHVELEDLEAHYLTRDGKISIPSLRYRGGIKSSSITLSDLTCFLPSLNTFNSTLFISSSLEGKGEKVSIPNLSITSSTGDVDINIDGWVQQISNTYPEWQANINNLNLSGKTINFIYENMQGRRLELPAMVSRLGDVHLTGIAKGEGISAINLHSRLNSDVGNMSLNFDLDKQRSFRTSLETKGISLRRLLADPQFGQLATNINIEGRLPSDGSPIINAKGVVNQFTYNGYHFRNIDVNGSYNTNHMIGKLSIDDPNLGLSIEGNVDREVKSNTVNIKAFVDHFSPQAIHLTDQWSDARFHADVVANFKASTVNDAVGTIDITDFNMHSSTENYDLSKLHIESGFEDETHFVRMDSDFGQIDLTGDFDYSTLPQSFTNFLAATLPTLPGLPKVNPKAHNNFVINATMSKSDWLQHLLQVPVDLKEPLSFTCMINDQMRDLAFECEIPSFYYKDSGYRQGRVSISSPSDTLRYDLSIVKLNDDSTPVDLHVYGKAADNNLHASLVWDNHQEVETMKGQVNVVSNFETTFDNKQKAHIRVLPSIINVHNSDWTIAPAYITYSKNYLQVKDLAVRHGQQHLIINGTASESTADSLFADLIDIDVEYILQLVDFDAVDFNGYASGTGVLRGVFGKLQADARLRVSDFEFQHGRMGTLYAEVDWNDLENQIDIRAVADDDDGKTYINGFVSPERNFIDLGIRADNTYLDFAHSFTESFISKIDGHGTGDVRLIGPLDAINLTGELVLNGIAHVKTLGCTYEMRNDTLRMVPNEIMFAHCPIYDIHGNEGMMTGGIHHQELTNLSYDIYVNTNKLMAYDFPDFGDENFYGTVYVDGNAAIHGHDGEVLIEADVTPLAHSVFVYNAASPDVITDQEFIQWGTKSSQGIPTTQQQKSQNTPTSNFRSDLTLRIKVNATPNATMRLLMDARTGDYITLQGTGDIQANYYNKGGFDMFGNYEVASGTYNLTIQEIIRKVFTFKEGGTIAFSGDPYDARLDLQAQHIVNGVSLSDLNIGQTFSNTVRVNCLMNISGQPRAPIIDFDLDMPSVNTNEKQMLRTMINGQEEMRQQVIYLLAVGRFYPQGSNNASEDDTQRSSTSLAMQSLLSGTLSGQLNNVLGQVINNNNWNFGANISTGDEGWNNAEYEGIINGRLLNNRLLINGQFGYRDNATTANPSFIGDFDIRYLLFPSGNLALKVYNQTNDRYFTRSSLNTQGIGIIMKKDFTSWRDLFRSKHKKKNVNNETNNETTTPKAE